MAKRPDLVLELSRGSDNAANRGPSNGSNGENRKVAIGINVLQWIVESVRISVPRLWIEK
jgi:hypothetical protein